MNMNTQTIFTFPDRVIHGYVWSQQQTNAPMVVPLRAEWHVLTAAAAVAVV